MGGDGGGDFDNNILQEAEILMAVLQFRRVARKKVGFCQLLFFVKSLHCVRFYPFPTSLDRKSL